MSPSRISIILSRRSPNAFTISCMGSVGPSSAARVAYCVIVFTFEVAWLWKEDIALAISGAAARYPSLQPVIAYDFDTPFTVMVSSFILGETVAIEKCFCPPYISFS